MSGSLARPSTGKGRSKVPELGSVPVRCEACPIRDRAVCALCEPDELRQLDSIKFYREIDAGAEVIGAGEDAGFVASIVTGVAKLTKTLADGRTQMVGLLFPGDFMGRARRGAAEFDAVAATDLRLCCFSRAPFQRLMAETPHLESRLLEMTLDELDSAREWMLLLGRKTAREKVASFIRLLANRAHGDRGPAQREITIPLTRAEMAEYLGLTIETVSRQMTKLRSDSVIDFANARSVAILDRDALEEAAGE